MKKPIRFLLALAGLFMLAMPGVAHASTEDFTVTDFRADYFLSKSDPQGALAVHESIFVDFTDQNHGIQRAIPKFYEGEGLHLNIEKVKRNGQAEQFTTYNSNGNEVVKIGNPNQTVTGVQLYELDYWVDNVIVFKANDAFIWNVNGTQWKQPFIHTSARLYVPAELAKTMGSTACYTGAFKSAGKDCEVTTVGNDRVYTATRTLQPGETLTVQANFAHGTFAAPTAADWWKDNFDWVLKLTLPPVLALLLGYLYWRKYGKDLKGRGTIIPEYEPPFGLHAAEADVVNNYKLGTNAISATIIDLAIRKYLRIRESESSGVLGLGKHTEYTFERLPKPKYDELKPYERKVLNALFPHGKLTEVKDLKSGFYVTAQALQKDLPKQLTTAGYFPRNPRTAGVRLYVIGITSIVVGFALVQVVNFGLAIAGAIIVLFAVLMPQRTRKGVVAKDTLLGLKMYMDVAEKDRIAMLQSPKSPYVLKTDAPEKTVELFEKLLPFAMILGVEKNWAKQFEQIYTTPPDWYSGNWSTFNAVYFVSALNSSVSTMNSSFAAPSTTGAGSGGSFAGGGGGGGGGGGW